MKLKKLPFALSFAIASVLVVGTTTFAVEPGNTNQKGSMMNSDGMDEMMEAMNSPEGKEMADACSNFMELNGDKAE